MEWPSFFIELTFATVIAEVAELQFLYQGIVGNPLGNSGNKLRMFGSFFFYWHGPPFVLYRDY